MGKEAIKMEEEGKWVKTENRKGEGIIEGRADGNEGL